MGGVHRFVHGAADDGAFAGGEAGGLHHDGSPVLADVAVGCLEAVEALMAGRGDAGLHHQLLGEGLRALDLGPAHRRAEDCQAPRLEPVDDTGDQRSLWADHGEVDVPGIREVGEPIDLLRLQGDGLGPAFGAPVAGGRVDLRVGSLTHQLPDERVLPAS